MIVHLFSLLEHLCFYAYSALYSQVTGEDLCRRSDDNEVTLRKRLQTYQTQTAPLIEFYSKLGLHSKVTASVSPAEVYTQVKAILDKSSK